jgi:hypothetical protein
MTGMDYYGELLDGEVRIDAFRQAIEARVKEGDRVLDLGTGLGTYAFFAARAGAGKVWGVDHDPVVHVAESLAEANGLGREIEFLRGKVPGVDLPRDVDLLIFEDFPVPLMNRETWQLLSHVQQEVLVPTGTMIPLAARLNLALVQSEEIATRIVPRAVRDLDRFGLRWEALQGFLANTPRKGMLTEDALVGAPVAGDTLPLMPLPGAADLRVEGAWDADTFGTVHALALWFDLEVLPGHWISNAPGPDTEAWGQWLLPLEQPLDVSSGEQVRASVAREILPGGMPGWLTWEASAGTESRVGHEFGGLAVGIEDLLPGERGPRADSVDVSRVRRDLENR